VCSSKVPSNFDEIGYLYRNSKILTGGTWTFCRCAYKVYSEAIMTNPEQFIS